MKGFVTLSPATLISSLGDYTVLIVLTLSGSDWLTYVQSSAPVRKSVSGERQIIPPDNHRESFTDLTSCLCLSAAPAFRLTTFARDGTQIMCHSANPESTDPDEDRDARAAQM
jgi:hypothetical protein